MAGDVAEQQRAAVAKQWHKLTELMARICQCVPALGAGKPGEAVAATQPSDIEPKFLCERLVESNHLRVLKPSAWFSVGELGQVLGECVVELGSCHGATLDCVAMTKGHITLVGGGPGAWDLLTIRGLRALEAADVILADHLGPAAELEDFLDLTGKEVVDVAKLPYVRQVAQERINEMLVSYAREGKQVVRLKGGDPYVFGRGFEELQACAAAGLECSVIPGVTSAVSVPAAANVPVTQRGVTHAFTVVSGHLPPEHPKSLVDWSALAQVGGTIVVVMGVRNVRAIVEKLLEASLSPDTPAAVIQEGETDAQRVFFATAATLPDVMENNDVTSPAVYVFGEVAGLAHVG